MKAVKINMSETKTSNSFKAVIIGTFVNGIVTIAFTVILAMFLNVAGNLFESIAGYIMLLPLIAGGYSGGYTSARVNKSNGLLLGVLSGIAVLIISLIIGFSVYNTDITYMLLLKALSILLPSALGGIKGVNKKEKFKI